MLTICIYQIPNYKKGKGKNDSSSTSSTSSSKKGGKKNDSSSTVLAAAKREKERSDINRAEGTESDSSFVKEIGTGDLTSVLRLVFDQLFFL